MSPRALVEALRPRQWTKNLFVLAPLLFGKVAFRPEPAVRTLAVCAAFCALASSLYLVNDLLDREADRLHPKKRHRPIADGRVSTGTAVVTALLLAAGATGVILAVAPAALLPAAAYTVSVTLYSFVLKRIPLLDVFVIAAGFVLRVLAGAAAAAVVPSHWLLLCTFFLALFLGLSKRRGELASSGSVARASLEAVPLSLLDSFENAALAITVVCYALYTVAPETVSWFGSDRLLFTVPFVVFGLFRWRLLETRGGGEDATSDLFTDRGLLLTVVLWGATCAGLIYLDRF